MSSLRKFLLIYYSKLKDWHVFIFITFILYAYLYRNLFSLNPISFTDLFVPFLTSREAQIAYSSPWLHIELGRPNTNTLISYLIILFENPTIIQKLWYLLSQPVSALTMYIFVCSRTNIRLAKFIVPIAYSLSPISIELFLFGDPSYLFIYMMFPLFLLLTIETIEKKDRKLKRTFLTCLVLGIASACNPHTTFIFFPFTIAFWISTFPATNSGSWMRHFSKLFILFVPYAFAFLTSSMTVFSFLNNFYNPINSVAIDSVDLFFKNTINPSFTIFAGSNKWIFSFLTVILSFFTLFIRNELRRRYTLACILIMAMTHILWFGILTPPITWLFSTFPFLFIYGQYWRLIFILTLSHYITLIPLIEEAKARGIVC